MAEVVLELEADLLDELQSTALERGFEGKGTYIRWVLEHHAALDPPTADPSADLGQSSEASLDPEADDASDVVIPEDTTGADDDDVARALEEIEDELDEEE